MREAPLLEGPSPATKFCENPFWVRLTFRLRKLHVKVGMRFAPLLETEPKQ